MEPEQMKVIRTVKSFPPEITGPGNTAYELTRHLEDRSISHHVITKRAEQKDSQISIDFDFDIDRIDTWSIPLKYNFSPRVLSILLKEEFQLVHAHSYRNGFTDLAYLVSRLKKVPFILHAHGSLLGHQKVRSDSSPAHRFHDLVSNKLVAKDSDAVIVSTKQEYEEAIQFGIEKELIHLIPEGKNPSKYTAVPKSSPKNEFRILFVGRIAPSRNVDVLIKSLPNLDEDVRLRVVGESVSLSGSNNTDTVSRLERLVAELGLGSRVEFVGPKYGDDLVKEYRSADLFAYMSSYENFSQPIVEAALSGLPVVSTPTGVASEIVDDGQTGYLVDYDNPEAVVAAVESARDRGVTELGMNLQMLAQNRFAWTQIIDEFEELYTSMLRSHNNSR